MALLVLLYFSNLVLVNKVRSAFRPVLLQEAQESTNFNRPS